MSTTVAHLYIDADTPYSPMTTRRNNIMNRQEKTSLFNFNRASFQATQFITIQINETIC